MLDGHGETFAEQSGMRCTLLNKGPHVRLALVQTSACAFVCNFTEKLRRPAV